MRLSLSSDILDMPQENSLTEKALRMWHGGQHTIQIYHCLDYGAIELAVGLEFNGTLVFSKWTH